MTADEHDIRVDMQRQIEYEMGKDEGRDVERTRIVAWLTDQAQDGLDSHDQMMLTMAAVAIRNGAHWRDR